MLIWAEAERFPVDCHHGRKGNLGQRGLNGLPGNPGTQGDVGPVGPNGPLATETYADFYFTDTTKISPGSFLFLTLENDLSPDFSISTDNSGTSVTFLRTGIFMLSYILLCSPGPRSVAVEATIDFIPVQFSRYGLDVAGKQLSGQVLIEIVSVGSVLRLRNPLADNLSFSSNGNSTNASLNVVRYGEPGINYYP